MLKNRLVYKKLDSSVEKTKNKYASVAVLFIDEDEILFIKRSENMPTHKGHIAFPGGKKENIRNNNAGGIDFNCKSRR